MRPALRVVLPLALISFVVGVLLISGASAAPAVSTDKANYNPFETVTITGTGFSPSTNYDVAVIRPDGSIVTGDGTETSGWDTALSDGSGGFVYSYQLNAIEGLYTVEIYTSPWGGPSSGDKSVATTTFWDGSVQHHQFRNGATKALTQGDEVWTKGNVGSANSDMTEGDSVAYRFEFDDVDAGTVIELEIRYEFNKDGQYAFDFLTDVERTEGAANLDLFGSPNSPLTGLSEASCDKAAIPIPDDSTHTFDNDLATAEGTQYFTVCGNFVALSGSCFTANATCV